MLSFTRPCGHETYRFRRKARSGAISGLNTFFVPLFNVGKNRRTVEPSSSCTEKNTHRRGSLGSIGIESNRTARCLFVGWFVVSLIEKFVRDSCRFFSCVCTEFGVVRGLRAPEHEPRGACVTVVVPEEARTHENSRCPDSEAIAGSLLGRCCCHPEVLVVRYFSVRDVVGVRSQGSFAVSHTRRGCTPRWVCYGMQWMIPVERVLCPGSRETKKFNVGVPLRVSRAVAAYVRFLIGAIRVDLGPVVVRTHTDDPSTGWFVFSAHSSSGRSCGRSGERERLTF